jgi:hypothetical protein
MWTKEQLIAYLSENHLTDCDRMTLVKRIMVATNGLVNPSVVDVVCKHFMK